jgi:hypothetical protein
VGNAEIVTYAIPADELPQDWLRRAARLDQPSEQTFSAAAKEALRLLVTGVISPPPPFGNQP